MPKTHRKPSPKPRKKASRPSRLTPAQKKFVDDAQGAIDETTGRTPRRVVETFVPPDLQVAGMKISSCGLGILSVLESIKHPFIDIAMHGQEKSYTIHDVQRALYIFTHPRDAKSAVKEGTLDEVSEAWVFDAEIGGDAVLKAPLILVGIIRGVMAMAPGHDPHAELSREKGEGSDPFAESRPRSPG